MSHFGSLYLWLRGAHGRRLPVDNGFRELSQDVSEHLVQTLGGETVSDLPLVNSYRPALMLIMVFEANMALLGSDREARFALQGQSRLCHWPTITAGETGP